MWAWTRKRGKMEGLGLDQEEGEDGPVCVGQTGRQRKEADISQSKIQV